MSTETPLYRLPRGSRDEAAGTVLTAAASLVVTIVLAVWIATQYVAIQFHFHPGLGPPLLTVPPPISFGWPLPPSSSPRWVLPA